MDAEVLIRRDGRLAQLILNRPKALNALTHGMVTAIAAALREWSVDGSVDTVLITGSGDRALCAGGDIVAIYRDALGDGRATERFWADEYALNAQINAYPKPIVAVMDGVVLGGGVGISAHASHRIVTERSTVGMPEAAIGFVPDVGGTWLLARAPGEQGTHLALTAQTVTGADAVQLGLADSLVASEDVPGLISALNHLPADTAIGAVAVQPVPAGPLAADRDWIDRCYSADDVESILARLQASPVEAARAAAAVILAKSPTALKVTLESLRRARTAGTLEEVLDQEYRVSLRMLHEGDFVEGIRAQVIDKDRTPAWSPARLEEVSRTQVAAHFLDLGEAELGLGTAPQHGAPHNDNDVRSTTA